MRGRSRSLALWGVGLALIFAQVTTTAHVQTYRYRPYLYESLYLPSGKFISELALGYRQVVADLVWFSATQYYGDYRRGNHDLMYFKGLIDIVTTLDPHFIFAYVFGAMVVSEDIGDFDMGVDILRQGMTMNPTSWRLPFEIGFLSYIHHENLERSARYFDLASRMPDAPEHTRRFAAYVYSRVGHADSAITLWEQYMEYTENPFLKELARRYVEKLKAERAAGGGSPIVQ
jgi:tetratricopeptide (TPR) repeat protein